MCSCRQRIKVSKIYDVYIEASQCLLFPLFMCSLYFCKVDFQKCFDTIDQQKLLRFLDNVFLEVSYRLVMLRIHWILTDLLLSTSYRTNMRSASTSLSNKWVTRWWTFSERWLLLLLLLSVSHRDSESWSKWCVLNVFSLWFRRYHWKSSEAHLQVSHCQQQGKSTSKSLTLLTYCMLVLL
jgi:hypothetical protein